MHRAARLPRTAAEHGSRGDRRRLALDARDHPIHPRQRAALPADREGLSADLAGAIVRWFPPGGRRALRERPRARARRAAHDPSLHGSGTAVSAAAVPGGTLRTAPGARGDRRDAGRGAFHADRVLTHLSCSQNFAPPEHLPLWSRPHWTIENRAHHVRDTALHADACWVCNGSLPRIMAAFAKLAISVLRLPGKRNMKRTMGDFKLLPNTAGRWRPAARREGIGPSVGTEFSESHFGTRHATV